MSIKIIQDNRKARFDYEILDTIEAGIVLTGSEVKSLRDGQVSLKDSYVTIRGQEAFLQKANIAVYKSSSYNNHEPERLRKLLLHHHQIVKMKAQIEEKGLTVVPTKIYFSKGKVKVELAVARGKKKGDKRETTKKREADREVSRALRHAKK